MRWSTSCYNHNDNNNDNHSYFEANPNSTTDSDRRPDGFGASAVRLSNNSVSLLQQRPGKAQAFSLAFLSQFGSKDNRWAVTGMKKISMKVTLKGLISISAYSTDEMLDND